MELPFDIDVERLKFQRDKLQEQVDLLDASKARKSEEQLKARKRATKNAIDKYQEALDIFETGPLYNAPATFPALDDLSIIGRRID